MVALASSATWFLVIVFVVWLAIGITLSITKGRRGHGMFQWLVIGAILGPLALPAAWSSIRGEASGRARPLETPLQGSGTVDVLVGIDGSENAMRALRTVIELVGSNLGRLTLASVVTFDEGSVQARLDEERAIGSLDAAVASVGRPGPGLVVLNGQPADALVHHAITEGYELLAIGRRGRGASKALLGSTAVRVADRRIPVLVV
jgi:nucleotide-binding universal stress UspA family protein